VSHRQYFWYVLTHKWFVFLAGLKTGAPLWRLVIHDWTKFTPAEWNPWRRRYANGRSNVIGTTDDEDDFRRAFAHHWHRHPHHWEHWVYGIASGHTPKALRIPDPIVREMVADWLGAGRAKMGHWDISEYFERNCQQMIVHDDNWPLIHELVNKHGR
jgi:hypothetical protein